MHVLIADDDPVYRSLLTELLKEWQFDVAVACNGSEAWEALQQDPKIRLVVLDWMMPEMDGFEVCRRLKTERGADVYTILITGSRKKEEIMKVLVAGADDYLIKPFDPVDLKIHVRNAVRILHLQEELDELNRSLKPQTSPSA